MNVDPKVVDTMIDQATEGDPGARRVIKAEVERLRAENQRLDERAAIAVEITGRRWSAVADELRKERDEARTEVERLRAIEKRAEAMVANNALESRRQAANIILNGT